jgi:hypothetical protein
MRWAGHVARMGRGKKLQGLGGESDHWGDPDEDGRILRWIFLKWDMGVWTGLSWLSIDTGGGHL